MGGPLLLPFVPKPDASGTGEGSTAAPRPKRKLAAERAAPEGAVVPAKRLARAMVTEDTEATKEGGKSDPNFALRVLGASVVKDGHSGQGVPSGAGAGTVAMPFFKKVARKHPYWYFTSSRCA